VIKKIVGYLSIFIILALSFTGCDGGSPKLSIEGARAELSPVMRGEGMVYLKIVNAGGKDTMMQVKTSVPGAAANLHEMRGKFMVLAKTMPIPAKSTVELQPMASHIMLENLPRDVKEGQPLTLTLVFQKSGEMKVRLVLMKAQP
jgi:copper(I)-binding protein